jgi:hypothetical protein
MDYKVYQEERKALIRKQEQLNKEREALDKKFAEEHPWNAYKGKKVRITNVNGGMTEEFYFDHIGACDFITQEAVGYTVKKDGTCSKIQRNYYFSTDNATIEEVEA